MQLVGITARRCCCVHARNLHLRAIDHTAPILDVWLAWTSVGQALAQCTANENTLENLLKHGPINQVYLQFVEHSWLIAKHILFMAHGKPQLFIAFFIAIFTPWRQDVPGLLQRLWCLETSCDQKQKRQKYENLKNNKKQLKRRQTRFAKGFQSLRLYKTDGTAPPARPMSPSSKSTRRSKAKDVTNVFQRFHSMVSGPSKQSCQGMGKNVVHEKCRYNRCIPLHIFLYSFIFWLFNWFIYVIEIYLFIHLCMYRTTSLFCVYFWMIKYILKKM